MIPASRNRAPARSDSWERVIAPKTLLLMLATPDLISLWIRGFPSFVRQIMTRTEGWRTIAQIRGRSSGHPAHQISG